MTKRNANLKRKAETETFGLANIGLVSTEETNVGDSRCETLDIARSWGKKRVGAPVGLSREVFTVKHAGLAKMEVGQGRKVPSSFTRSSTSPVAKQVVAARDVSKNSVVFGGGNRDLKQKNFLSRAPKRDLSTAAVDERAVGPSPPPSGQNSLPDPGEAYLGTSQTIKHVEVLTLESGTHEQKREVDVAPPTQETGCTNTATPAAESFKTRAYQTEMFQESLRRNIILCVSGNL